MKRVSNNLYQVNYNNATYIIKMEKPFTDCSVYVKSNEEIFVAPDDTSLKVLGYAFAQMNQWIKVNQSKIKAAQKFAKEFSNKAKS